MIKRVATSGERAVYSFLDGFLFFVVWHVVFRATKVRTPFGVHKRPYTEEHLLKYLETMFWMMLALLIASVVLHRLAGGSFGKLALGFRTQRIDGRPAGWRMAAIRAAALFGLGVVILAPGPVAFYGLGLDPAEIYWPLLGGGLSLWFILTVYPFGGHGDAGGRTLLEKWLGLETVWFSPVEV